MPYWHQEWSRCIVRPKIPWTVLFTTNLKRHFCLHGLTGGTIEDSLFSVLYLQVKQHRE